MSNVTTYFLKHPVATVVLNIMIIIIGALCFKSLSLREYPEVNFPRINILTAYPNASPELIETTVTNPLEDQLAGVEGVDRMQSYSRYGASSIKLSFKNGTSIDRALMAVREAVDLANLPYEAKKPMIERKTGSDGLPFMVVSLESSSMDFGELTHHTNLYLKNAFRGIQGVSSVEIAGQPYTYVVTLDPTKMYTFGVNTDDIFNALQRSNISTPVGKFQNKIPANLTIELKNQSDYENLVVKENISSNNHHSVVTLNNVATIKLTTDDQQSRVRVNGKPGIAIALNISSEANPLNVSDAVRAQVEILRKHLPQGLVMETVVDQADFVRSSLHNIKSSVIEAVLLVLLIVFLFLRNLKAALIPLMTIPISLLGSFIFLRMFGFSINTLTLMAMVLAVGLVVDDAIVVLENIQRHIEQGKSKAEAAFQGAKEISFAIVAMTLTLTSVYAPLAFISGTVGQLFTEFAVALAGSVLISGIVALTLSPLMCSHMLSDQPKHLWPNIDVYLNHLKARYQSILTRTISYKKCSLAIIAAAFSLIFLFTQVLPKEIAPQEDRGLIGAYLPPIAGQTLDDMEKTIQAIETIVQTTPEAKTYLTFIGSWGGNVLVPLPPHTSRKRSASEIVDAMQPLLTHFPSVDAYPFSFNSGLPGADQSDEQLQLKLVISTTDSYQELFENIERAKSLIDQEKIFQDISHNLNLNTPGYRIDLNTNEMALLGLRADQIAKTIEVFFSGDQSLSFSKDHILYPLMIKGTHYPWTLNELYITNPNGQRLSLGTVATITATAQPDSLYHNDQVRSVTLSASLKTDDNLQDSMSKLMHAASQYLPEDYKKTWVGAAKKYADSKTTTALLFLLSIIFIFAILAVQFENIIDPFIILLTVPLACSGALFLSWALGQSFNIYTQVGLITLIGIITKHGILIVEFANQLREQKLPVRQAIITAAALRLRPILMTTGAMLLGAIPLLLSQDAGHESRFALGTVLIGGLSFGTLFTLFVLPAVYWMVHARQSKTIP